MERVNVYGFDLITWQHTMRTYLDACPIYGEQETMYYPDSGLVRVEGHLGVSQEDLPLALKIHHRIIKHWGFDELSIGATYQLSISYHSAASPVKVQLIEKLVAEQLGSDHAGPHKYYLLFKVSDDQAQPVTKLPWLRLLRYRIKAWWPW